MNQIVSTIRIIPTQRDEDRVVHQSDDSGDTIILADGAGGLAGGRYAAEFLLTANVAKLVSPRAVADELARLDHLMAVNSACGESTAVIVRINDGMVWGASVGDSGAWLLLPSEIIYLTANQKQKPLLGSSSATPIGFGYVSLQGRLLVASDGLLKYVPVQRIHSLGILPNINQAASELAGAVQFPSGGWHDDVSFALVELAA